MNSLFSSDIYIYIYISFGILASNAIYSVSLGTTFEMLRSEVFERFLIV